MAIERFFISLLGIDNLSVVVMGILSFFIPELVIGSLERYCHNCDI